MKQTNHSKDFELRVAHIENSLLRWRSFSLLMLVLIFGSVLVGFTTKGERSVTADAIAIEDKFGNTRLGIFVDEDDDPVIHFFTKSGKTRQSFWLGEQGPVIVQYDSRGKQRVSLSVVESIPQLTMWDEHGQKKVSLVISEDNFPYLNFFYEDEKIAVSVGLNALGPVIGLVNEDGVAGIGIVSNKEMGSKVVQLNEDGEVEHTFP